jgi:hypothetical protein
MDILQSIVLGGVALILVSVLSGLIIRKTSRKQTGWPFYCAMFCLICLSGFGLIPLFGLHGVDKNLAYAVAAGASALIAQYLFGQQAAQ